MRSAARVGEPRPTGGASNGRRALPEDRPRYLMGVGTPRDLVHAVAAGFDLFDCVLPARNARHGLLFTSQGPLRIKNAAYRQDPGPLDPACGCRTCASVSRGFLHHLVRAGEITAATLATVHNVRFYLDFMERLREAITSGSLAEFAAHCRLRHATPAAADTGEDRANPLNLNFRAGRRVAGAERSRNVTRTRQSSWSQPERDFPRLRPSNSAALFAVRATPPLSRSSSC
jgi:hypothetical protein